MIVHKYSEPDSYTTVETTTASTQTHYCLFCTVVMELNSEGQNRPPASELTTIQMKKATAMQFLRSSNRVIASDVLIGLYRKSHLLHIFSSHVLKSKFGHNK